MSVEHPLFPTKNGLKVLEEMKRLRMEYISDREKQINDSLRESLSHLNDKSLSVDDITADCNVSQTADLAALLVGRGPSKSIYTNILRVDVRSTGWVIERNVKKPTHSIVSYIINMNFGGNLPSSLVKPVAKKLPLGIYHLGKALKKRKHILKRRMRDQQKTNSVLLSQQIMRPINV